MCACLPMPSWFYPQIGRIVRVPFIKFMNHGFAYLLFLVLLFIATLRSPDEPTVLFQGSFGVVNIVILLYVAGK